MFYKVGHGPLFSPAAMPRTFRKQLTLRVRAATSSSAHVSQTQCFDIRGRAPDRVSNLAYLVRDLVAQIGEWWQPTREAAEGDLTMEEMTQQLQNELESTEMESETGLELTKASWPNIWKFLQPVSLEEVQKSRFMASLSHVSYCLSKITNPHFFSRYGLQFVTSSLKCKQPAKTAEKMDDALKTSDGMAVANSEIPKCRESANVDTIEVSNIVSVSPDLQRSLNATQDSNSGTENWNFGSLSNSIYSQPLVQFAKHVSLAASVSQSAVSVTLTRVMSLLQSTLRSSPPPSSAQSLQDTVPIDQDSSLGQGVSGGGGGSPPVLGKCPTEWFVCDDVQKETRIFCIQGSDNFESWRTNLQFDPVVFEDEKLGVKVHRGIYKAALSLYGLFVPLIRDHLKNGRGKKISFTGHSLGGAISTVLMMILVHRGVLEPRNVGQVFTFGGAACFCDNCDCSTCVFETDLQSSANQKLLEQLHLPTSTVLNIIMHKDITPRAFSSDYSPVAEFLKNWSSSFRTHGCLSSPGRSLLYNFIGEILVLQPDAGIGFVNNEGYHPMLPEEAGLFRLVDPDQGSLNLAEKLRKEWKIQGQNAGKEVDDKEEAFLALMDNPHPLDILSDTRAYGVMGAISRYHNPAHYVLGLRSTILNCEMNDPQMDI